MAIGWECKMIKILRIQYQYDERYDERSEKILVALFSYAKQASENSESMISLTVESDHDNGYFTNYKLYCENLSQDWKNVRQILQNDFSEEMNSMIVVCEGEDGFDDYLLLHHFDKGEKLDEI